MIVHNKNCMKLSEYGCNFIFDLTNSFRFNDSFIKKSVVGKVCKLLYFFRNISSSSNHGRGMEIFSFDYVSPYISSQLKYIVNVIELFKRDEYIVFFREMKKIFLDRYHLF